MAGHRPRGTPSVAQLSLDELVGNGTDARRDGIAPSPRRRQRPARPKLDRAAGHVGVTVASESAEDPARRPLLLTVDEAAQELHIGRRQTWELVWRGELPVVRLGPRTLRVAYPVLERFVLERSGAYGP